ncbi:extensin-like [Vicia villosa]|uniref:extensin-like n=1 Tax=Vicia villosa TaxID=3911 RepID=UPI00273A80ED|nr:extensin-like [Vicia villosa]
MVEQKEKKRKTVGEVPAKQKQRGPGIVISEPDYDFVFNSKNVSVEANPEIQPEKAPAKPPPTTKVLTPSPSPKSKGTTPILDYVPLASEPIFEAPPLNTIIPPHANISISQPPPHLNYTLVNNAELFPFTPSSPEPSNSDSFTRLMKLYPRKPKPTPDVVVLDSDHEAESSQPPSQTPSSETEFVLDRVPQAYALSYPDKQISSLHLQIPNPPPRTSPPRPSVDTLFELLTLKVRIGLDALKVAHDAKLDHVAAGKIWRIVRREI